MEKTQILLQDLRSFLDGLPGHMGETQEVRQRLAAAAELFEGGEGATTTRVADEFGDWLVGYFQLVLFPSLHFGKKSRCAKRWTQREHIINFEDLRLWEIWYTGPTPFPSEVCRAST